MRANDRRTQNRRGGEAESAGSGTGNGVTRDRRTPSDRRVAPRRRADLRTIAQFAARIDAGHTRLEVIVDGTEGLRLVAVFACGCRAVEPVGTGKPSSLRVDACAAHAEPPVARERRRG